MGSVANLKEKSHKQSIPYPVYLLGPNQRGVRYIVRILKETEMKMHFARDGVFPPGVTGYTDGINNKKWRIFLWIDLQGFTRLKECLDEHNGYTTTFKLPAYILK